MNFLIAEVMYFLSDTKMNFSQWDAMKIKSTCGPVLIFVSDTSVSYNSQKDIQMINSIKKIGQAKVILLDRSLSGLRTGSCTGGLMVLSELELVSGVE